MPPIGETDAHAGVIATRPATMPDAAPRLVGLPSRIRSVISQPSIAAQVARMVFIIAKAAGPLAPSADPALKPEPAEPQQPGAEHHQREVVRAHRLTGPADALAEDERERERRRTGVD